MLGADNLLGAIGGGLFGEIIGYFAGETITETLYCELPKLRPVKIRVEKEIDC